MSAETARMTLRVYEVNRAGITRIVREETAVKPLERPEASHQFPPCQCSKCVSPAR
ncbi:hypothetical protein J7F02_05930 [Streptomyces sp. ISL-112]|uniref:hypothetical protein n=1 Tax=unclassified Streptomyces TaxID=2593676 RepID=UPI001BE7A3D6|nr:MULTISPECIES: hypothetical protein [unclassified Streptomyces]MBT2425236.1 hypothetical protein [Streptomyces sp. ISL-112]MBT2462027.1 hypothetical protein [Streptomyces sp. ISL-63]